MVVDFLVVVVIDVLVRIDGGDIRFVAIANMLTGYHAGRE